MSCIIDHLRVDHQIRIICDFTDLDGRRHRTNETGVLRVVSLDWAAQAIVLEWERDGRRETMRFSLNAKAGPRNGSMREFFEMGEDRSPRRSPSAANPWREKRVFKLEDWPAPSANLITDVRQWSDAVKRIAGLAARSRFPEIDTQIQALLVDAGPTGWRIKQLADDLAELAAAHADSDNSSVYEWLRDRSINLLYAWGSCATSGGEGALCPRDIRACEERFAQIDRAKKEVQP
jgi:hypothetical protein